MIPIEARKIYCKTPSLDSMFLFGTILVICQREVDKLSKIMDNIQWPFPPSILKMTEEITLCKSCIIIIVGKGTFMHT